MQVSAIGFEVLTIYYLLSLITNYVFDNRILIEIGQNSLSIIFCNCTDLNLENLAPKHRQ